MSLSTPAVPNASPQNIQAVPLSSTALSLTWQPPPLDRQNGIILGYFINMTEVDTDQHFLYTSNTTSLMVTGRHPHYTYSFKIAAETVVGRGPPSQAHMAMTLEDGMCLVAWHECIFIVIFRQNIVSSNGNAVPSGNCNYVCLLPRQPASTSQPLSTLPICTL